MMLEPGRRRLFLDALRPPDGYVLDRAVGTTFTLDLMALLAVPLAFTFREAQDGEGRLSAEPLALLESARRYADRITLFCHGGRTGVPRPAQRSPALAFIEDSVTTVFPPPGNRPGSVFHPKVWVLRYVARDGAGPIRYRLVCQSRNLTFDASWDASLVLDGELGGEDGADRAINRPLADFIGELPGLAPRPMARERAEAVGAIAGDLRSVRFDPPRGMELSRFLAFGIGGANPAYPDLERRPLLVVSPFLGDGLLLRAAGRRPRSVLVSRREALLTASAEAVGAFDEVYAFRSGLDPEPEDAAGSLAPLAGLHAKLFVTDDGWRARVAVGSANATQAAIGERPGNVEFMVELSGSKAEFGIDALLAPAGRADAGTFRGLIEEFDPAEAGTGAEDPEAGGLARLLDAAAEAVARIDLAAAVSARDGGRYALRLEMGAALDLPEGIVDVTCWPATISSDHRRPLGDGAEFTGLSLDELSAFLAVEVRASAAGASGARRFARTVPLRDLPADRLRRLIAGMLRDRERFLQMLWLLLSPDQELSPSGIGEALSGGDAGAGWGAAMPGLLERMLETLGSDPDRLDAVASLLEDLRGTEEGRELMGEEFDAVWDALWTVRCRRR